MSLGSKPFAYNDTGFKLVHACVGERPGLATLHRATDSSSLSQAAVQGTDVRWKRRSEARDRASTESVAVVTLDDSLQPSSLAALGWAHYAPPQGTAVGVGFLKIE